jgi:hypothetical protein
MLAYNELAIPQSLEQLPYRGRPMRTKVRLCVAFALSLFFSSSLSAADIPVDVAFSNGVFTRQEEANQHALRLQDDLRTDGRIPALSDEIHLLYHVDDFPFGNLTEVLIQKEIEVNADPAQTKEWAKAYFELLADTADISDPDVAKLIGTSEAQVEQRLRAMRARDRIKTQVRSDVDKLAFALHHEKIILLVSHSQGNLYSNASVLGLFNESPPSERELLKNVRVVGVGVPAAYLVQSDGSPNYRDYVTNSGDRVIGLLSILPGLPALKPDIDIPTANPAAHVSRFQAFQGHGFETIYLNPDLPGNRFFLDIAVCVLSASRSNCGPVKASAPNFDPDRTPVPKELQDARASASSKLASKAQMKPDKTPPEFPKDAVALLAKSYELNDDETKLAFNNYVMAVWDFWEKTRNLDKYSPTVEYLDVRALEAQICFERVVTANPKHVFLRNRYLVGVQSTLASTLSAFKDYAHADSLMDNQAVTVLTDKESACGGKMPILAIR